MQVGIIRFELFIPTSHSLKEKRAAIKPIIEGAKRRFGVAVAEVAHQNTWQRADLGVAAVAASVGHVEDVLDEVERFVWSHPEVEVLCAQRSWLEEDRA
ncbi:MAG: DUF503 domain-containing protein [Actinobacteria bacterium]|nr:DUF503 domain-containing protein [Actinomycetota bacterium]